VAGDAVVDDDADLLEEQAATASTTAERASQTDFLPKLDFIDRDYR
jgi:hypothetical protein